MYIQMCVQLRLYNFYTKSIVSYLKFVKANYKFCYSIRKKPETLTITHSMFIAGGYIGFATDLMARYCTCILRGIHVFYFHIYFPIGNQRRKLENQNKKGMFIFCFNKTIYIKVLEKKFSSLLH